MTKTTRKISLLLAAIIIFGTLLCSCGNTKDENNIAESETVLTASGYSVSYGLYRYFFLNYKSAYTQEQLAENSAQIYSDIKASCYESLRGIYAVVAMCAEYGISTDSTDIQSRVDDTIAQIKAQYIDEENDKTGEKGFKKALKANFMTEDVLRYVTAVDLCEETLYTKMIGESGVIASDDETVSAALYGDEFICVKQIYIDSENGEEYEKNKKTAEEAYKKAASGEDFDTLVANYSNDYTMTKHGYYITRGYMSEKFEDVAFALDVGEVSEILELSDGFHIIKRLEKDSDYIEQQYEELKDRYLTCKFYEKVDAKQETVTITETALFSEIDPALISLD